MLKNKYTQLVLTLLIGIGIGAIFYPSKTITKEEMYKFEQKIERLETEKKNLTSFYEKQINKEEREHKEFKEEITKKTESLREENFQLKQKVSEKRFKIVRPDGTVEEKWFKDSETDVVSSTVTKIKSEFTRKVTEIENKWKSIHEKRISKIRETYERKIAESKNERVEIVKKKKVQINKKSFGLSLGYTSDQKYFSSIMYDVYGPFFLDLHLDANQNLTEKTGGIGIGMRF